MPHLKPSLELTLVGEYSVAPGLAPEAALCKQPNPAGEANETSNADESESGKVCASVTILGPVVPVRAVVHL